MRDCLFGFDASLSSCKCSRHTTHTHTHLRAHTHTFCRHSGRAYVCARVARIASSWASGISFRTVEWPACVRLQCVFECLLCACVCVKYANNIKLPIANRAENAKQRETLSGRVASLCLPVHWLSVFTVLRFFAGQHFSGGRFSPPMCVRVCVCLKLVHFVLHIMCLREL